MPMLELILFSQVVLGKDANLVNSVDHLFNNFPTKDYNFCYNDQIKCFLLLKEILSMTFFFTQELICDISQLDITPLYLEFKVQIICDFDILTLN
jgi:hypothetical protein